MEIWLSGTLALLGFLISWYFSKHSKNINHEKMMKELFKEFNERYDALNEYLVQIEKKYPAYEEFQKIEDQELKHKVIDYFNLCAEEYFWYHHKDRIDPIIWKTWQKGMSYWYSIPTIRQLWDEELESSGPESYYIKKGERGFFIKGK